MRYCRRRGRPRSCADRRRREGLEGLRICGNPRLLTLGEAGSRPRRLRHTRPIPFRRIGDDLGRTVRGRTEFAFCCTLADRRWPRRLGSADHVSRLVEFRDGLLEQGQ